MRSGGIAQRGGLAGAGQPRPLAAGAGDRAGRRSGRPRTSVGLIAADDAIRRNAALEALTKGGRRSVPALVRALSDPDPEVVMFAAQTLGKTRDPSAIPHLAALLRHGDINVCQAAIESLGELRAVSMLDTLGELLKGDSWLRFAVVHTLGEIGDPSSVRTLIALLDDEHLRDGAIAALGKIGGLEVLAELAKRMAATRPSCSGSTWRRWRRAGAAPRSGRADEAPPWSSFAGRAERLAPRLKQLLQTTTRRTAPPAGPEGSGGRSRPLPAPRGLLPGHIVAAPEERLGEALLFAAADIGAALEPHLAAARRTGIVP